MTAIVLDAYEGRWERIHVARACRVKLTLAAVGINATSCNKTAVMKFSELSGAIRPFYAKSFLGLVRSKTGTESAPFLAV
jgi:hypothetical protein